MKLGSRIKLIMLVCSVFATLNYLAANEPEKSEHQNTPITSEAEHQGEKQEHEKFDPGKFMFDHIKDAYSWHIIDIGHTSLSIPLPVILYSKEKGWNFFMSGRFNHGHSEYKGFKIAGKGNLEGRVVEIQADGSENLPLLD